jgi:hypothetical protein
LFIYGIYKMTIPGRAQVPKNREGDYQAFF